MILKGKRFSRWLDLNWLLSEFKGLTENSSAMLPFWSIDIRPIRQFPTLAAFPHYDRVLLQRKCVPPPAVPFLPTPFSLRLWFIDVLARSHFLPPLPPLHYGDHNSGDDDDDSVSSSSAPTIFCLNYLKVDFCFSVQEERRYGGGRAALGPQEAAIGFYGPPASYPTGYF